MKDFEDNILCFCDYCKDPIFVDEAFVGINGNKYHKFCYKQMRNGVSLFEDEVEDEI